MSGDCFAMELMICLVAGSPLRAPYSRYSSVRAPIVSLQYVISPIRQVKRHWILVTAAAYTVLYLVWQLSTDVNC